MLPPPIPSIPATRRRLLPLLLALAALIAPAAHAQPRTAASPDTPRWGTPLRVVVSIPPLVGIVQPLLPPGSTVETLIPPGVSEHGYEIPPSKLAAIARADILVTVGLGLEPRVDRFVQSNRRPSRFEVVFAKAVADHLADAPAHTCDHPDHDHHHHDHAPGEPCNHGHHHHAGTPDPHLWLDPVLVARLVPAVRDAVEGALRDHNRFDSAAADRLNAAAAALTARLDALHTRYAETISAAPGRTIVVAHDAYGWLARRYGLTVVPIAGLAANEPTPAAIQRATEAVRSQGLPVVFLEPQLNTSAGKRIAAATGVQTLMLDPLGDGDYFATMEKNLEALKAGLAVSRAATPPPHAPAPSASPTR